MIPIDWKEINSFLPFSGKVLNKYFVINFLGQFQGGWVSMSVTVLTLVSLQCWLGCLFSPLSSLPSSSTGRLCGKHILITTKSIYWAAVAFFFFF